ncbi:two-component regulator propeller domain-containing protein [Shewanella aegiceratis]|uniref:two-component regulator propeller domain-containing protein n=1 Tax=Shewanella aegiceratis TaxID=2864203 RepID=UPI001C65802C|nr:two-component regulator propeller domain-containing protein [Shewanella aegiceratis]QYJ81467.1 PAS domain-containing protein [Shewanella aegiceratis]
MRALILSLLLLLLVSQPSLAFSYQPQFDSFGAKEGLSMNTVTDIVNDKEGHLWIATQAGLNRYDGKRFKIFDTQGDNRGPSAKYIKKLHFSRTTLWLITRNDGINRYHADSGIFEPFNASNSPLPDDIVDLDEDAQGNLWIATADNRLLYFSPASNKLLATLDSSTTQGLPSGRINTLYRDRQDRLWVGTLNGLASLKQTADEISVTQYAPEVLRGVSAIEAGKSNTLWVGTQTRGLFLLDITNDQAMAIAAVPASPAFSISALRRDKFGSLWIGFRAQGLARYEPSRNEIHRLNASAENRYSINSPVITSLWIDNEQQLWIGSKGGGLSKTFLDAQYFGHIHGFSFNDNNLLNVDIRSLLEDSQGTLWVGTASGVYRGLKNPRGELTGFIPFHVQNPSLSQAFISFIKEDEPGQLWIGTRGDGLFIYTADKQSYIHYLADAKSPNSLPSNQLYSLYFDRQGTPWITSSDGGIARYAGIATGFIAVPLPIKTVTDMLQDGDGNYWLTSSSDGLLRLAANGEITHFASHTPHALPKQHLFSIVAGDNHSLWIASNEGLLHFNTQDFSSRLLTTADGLIDDTIYLLFADQRRHLWLGTTKGLTQLDPGSLKTTNYTDIDGIQDNEFNFGAAALGRNNSLYLGGVNGFNHFNPAQLPRRQPPTLPVITDLFVLDQAQGLPDMDQGTPRLPPSLALPHTADIFSLHYHSPDLHNATRLSYQYRLLGLNDTWIAGSPEQVAYFTGLNPGNYLFEIRAKDINQQYSPIRRLKIMLEPAPWQSPFAYTLYFTLTLMLVSLIFYRKWSQYQQQAALLHEVAQSEQRLQLALWGSGDEFWDWNIVHGNATRTNTFLKYPEQEQELKKTIATCVHPDDIPKVSRVAKECINDQIDKFSLTYRGLAPDGEWLWVLNRGQVVERDEAGKAVRIAGTIKNIQQQKETEHALRELNQRLEQRVNERTLELQQRNDELKHTLDELEHTQGELMDKEKMAALGGLVASITHEVNTPIGISVTAASHLQESVKHFDQLYRRGEITEEDFEQYQNEVAECCRLILANLERASKLIASFKQVSVDQSHEDVREFDLHAYLEEIFISLNPMLSRTPHEYSYQCPEKLIIQSTPGAFYQIVSNLFNNSVIHAYPDGKSGKLSLDVARTDQGICITYQDDGCGMSQEVQAQVFQPFFTTKRGKGGSGLGMNIVSNIVTQVLKGEISIDSQEGRGSTFIIHLPDSLIVR